VASHRQPFILYLSQSPSLPSANGQRSTAIASFDHRPTFPPPTPGFLYLYQKRMLPIEHIGIAVKDLSTSIPLFEKLLNGECYKTEVVESEQVKTAFFKAGEAKIELLESLAPDGVIARFLEKKGEGIHHIAFAVEDINTEVQRLEAAGFEFLDKTPKKGADNKLVCFIHPRSANGILVELCQDIKPQ
jgi:methylmalonyl-CoA/ethylmalonyl-CoA epimerase